MILLIFVRGLSHAGKSSTLQWAWAIVVLVETLVLGGLIFAKRLNTKTEYRNVAGDEIDEFVIGDVGDEEEKWNDPDSRTK